MLIAESATAVAAWGAPHCWTSTRRSCLHSRPAGVAHAQTVDRSAYSPKVKQNTGRERVLRYPDGRVRCIRYPLTATDIDAQSDQIDVTHSYEEDWDPDRWDDIDWPWEACGLWEGAASEKAAVATAAVPPVQGSQALQKTRHTFNTPADLLRTLNAAGYLQAQQDLMKQVRNSYEIHTGSPWIESRPVFVLVQQQPNSEIPVTYTLKTKVSWTAAEDEISKVLKRRRADGSPLIQVDQLRDGIVLFEDVADAERYSNYMEAESNAQVLIARCDAHDLFRNVQEVRGVVIVLRKGANVPTPHQLAVSLRNKQSLEGD